MSKERVREAFEQIGRGSPQAFLELLASDVVYTLIGTTPGSGVHRGRDAVQTHLFGPLGAALATPLALELDHLLVDGDRVIVQARGHARLRSGAPYHNSYCFVLRFAGDRIGEVTEYLDTHLVARAFGVPAERPALLRAMDLNLWAMVRHMVREARGGELRELPGLTLALNPRGMAFHNMVLVRDAPGADALLAATRDFYGRRGVAFSVWTRTHADAELETALAGRGFREFVRLPAMALLGDPGTACAPAGLTVRPVRDERGRRDYAAVTAEAYSVYGSPREVAEDLFVTPDSLHGPDAQGFVGYHEGAPVAAAMVFLSHGVAGINWVGTVAGQRGQGFGEAVTWAAVREGFRRGAAFANLQASPMGRPIYERMGFITPSAYRVLVAEG